LKLQTPVDVWWLGFGGVLQDVLLKVKVNDNHNYSEQS